MGAGQQVHQGAHSYRLASLRKYPDGYLGTYMLGWHTAEELPTNLRNCRCTGGW